MARVEAFLVGVIFEKSSAIFDSNFGALASRTIPARTIVEISPVLLFSSEEYEAHGKHTVLDHYTFKQRDGRMALALGLGASL